MIITFDKLCISNNCGQNLKWKFVVGPHNCGNQIKYTVSQIFEQNALVNTNLHCHSLKIGKCILPSSSKAPVVFKMSLFFKTRQTKIVSSVKVSESIQIPRFMEEHYERTFFRNVGHSFWNCQNDNVIYRIT